MAPLFFGFGPFEPIRFTSTQSAKSEIGFWLNMHSKRLTHTCLSYIGLLRLTLLMSLKNYRLCLAARLFFLVLTARFGMGYQAASALGHLFNYVLFPYVCLYFVFLHMLYLVLHIFAFFILNLYIWFLRTLYFKRSRWLLAGASQRLHRH